MTPEEFIQYENDVRQAREIFPTMEIGQAYDKFMTEVKKQTPIPRRSTTDPVLRAVQTAILQTFHRPCLQPGCPGQQTLQGVCEGCAAFKRGFLSVWECDYCLKREYSQISYLDWFKKMTGE